jgi:hypothetical protein
MARRKAFRRLGAWGKRYHAKCELFSETEILSLILQITFFEILIGRTPFEAHASEDFSTQDQLTVYYDRTLRGEWLGEWEMSNCK